MVYVGSPTPPRMPAIVANEKAFFRISPEPKKKCDRILCGDWNPRWGKHPKIYVFFSGKDGWSKASKGQKLFVSDT